MSKTEWLPSPEVGLGDTDLFTYIRFQLAHSAKGTGKGSGILCVFHVCYFFLILSKPILGSEFFKDKKHICYAFLAWNLT